uniref:Uncharacterized protein n=1 Tax=Knipowitschia caucasica TaxID=637954 RepID=A0AAV2M385_KNICA
MIHVWAEPRRRKRLSAPETRSAASIPRLNAHLSPAKAAPRTALCTDPPPAQLLPQHTPLRPIHVPLGAPAITKIPVYVEEHNVTEGALKLIKELRPAWDTGDVKTKVKPQN